MNKRSRSETNGLLRYLVCNVAVAVGENTPTIRATIAQLLAISTENICSLKRVRRSLDARQKRNIHFLCSFEVELNTPLPQPLPNGVKQCETSLLVPQRPTELPLAAVQRPRKAIVIGAGPAGLFAALALAEAGIQVHLLERGKPVETRMRDIGRLRSRGELNSESNICFGEGGAGTYTDGKLYTRIKHPYLRWVLATFIRFGAKEDILVDAHPHLGTDRLIRIVRNMRKALLALGVDYRFNSRVDDLLVSGGCIQGVRIATGEELLADTVVLATGHSARDTYAQLHKLGIHMEAKPFAIGVRAEHPQPLIDQIQYQAIAGHPELGAAEYALTHQVADAYLGKRGVYTFCMCPGGLIVPSPTEHGGMAVNGMSNAKRSGAFANSGIVVQVTPEDIERHGIGAHPLAGVAFQREIEAATFAMANYSYAAPAMRMTDFIAHKSSGTIAPTRFKPSAIPTDLWQIFPDWLANPLAEGIKGFGQKMHGYISDEANLLASETRTSSPVRITRGDDLQSLNLIGLYPVGEGAGYAGGIVSAAVDGLKAAAMIIAQHGKAL